MLIAGGKVFANGMLRDADVVVREGRIADVIARDGSSAEAVERASANAGDQVIDAAGCIVSPGLIDLHFHGCAGSDICDATPEALRAIAEYEASRGVTAICPATMTYPESLLQNVMSQAAAFEPKPNEAALVGINMEGPFISPSKVGAQNPAYVQPCDAAMFRRLQETARGLVKLVDVAPEEPGALEFIREVAGETRISLAHTCADYACAAEAFESGARQLTHMFNAMPPLHHRAPGPIGAAAERDDVTPELIADGVHVHPSMVRLAFSLFDDGRVILISDSMRACGLGSGVFDLGGQDVHVKGSLATLADGTIAGSVTDLASCVRIAVLDMGIPLESALRAATENPARALGIEHERGAISEGKVADIVVFGKDLDVKHVIIRGELLGAAE